MQAIMKFLCVCVVFVSIIGGSLALPSGAPSTACVSMMPQSPHSSGGLQSNPSGDYIIDISSFSDGDGSFSYIPGARYGGEEN